MKKIVFLLSISVALLTPTTALLAQEQKTFRELAEGYYNRQEYAKGLPLFEKLWNKDKNNIALLERIANSYRQINNYSKAEEWYDRLVHTVPDKNAKDSVRADHYLSYIEVLQNNKNYEKALTQVDSYLNKGGSKERAIILSEGCKLAPEWISRRSDYSVDEMKSWNTALADWGASYYGSQLVFASERGGGKEYMRTLTPYTKLYLSTTDTSAEIRGFSNLLNDYKYHVGPVIFNKTLDTLYFTRTNTEKSGLKYAREADRTQRALYRLELFTQTRNTDSGWSAPLPFNYNEATQYSMGHAALSPSGDILYYVSDKAGGYGGTDIYFSERQADGSWGQPQNCGPGINTFGDELFPTISEDGTLYYSTDGKPGLGGLDLFYSIGSGKQWSNPENLGYPLNSAGDDFHLQLRQSETEDLATGYFSSNRTNGTGSDDIYSFSRPFAITVNLNGVVTNRQTGEQLSGVRIELIDLSTNKKLAVTTAADGTYHYHLDRNRTYRVVAMKKGFQTGEAEVSTANLRTTTNLTKDLQLTPGTTAPSKIVLYGIYYDFDKSDIRDESEPELNKVLGFLRENPGAIVELGSHTDSRASYAYNNRLSQRRAESVVEWLVLHGVARSRMQAKGYGESQPVNGCTDGVSCSEYEHQRNRRTEIRIVSGDIDIKSLERFNMRVDPKKRGLNERNKKKK